jgi:glutathione synthase/RimK-type ligase-like ATP-grasp enzyme
VAAQPKRHTQSGQVVLIVSVRDDLHALAVQRELLSRGQRCEIFCCDQISGREAVSVTFSRETKAAHCVLAPADHESVDIADIEVIWWRRVRANQANGSGRSPQETALIDNDSRGALEGALRVAFRGRWVSSPDATDLASNKLYQLAIAKSLGFRIPETLVSQSPTEVHDFCNRFDHVIVKPVVGTPGPLLFTQFVTASSDLAPESFRACPAIYQEFIQGSRHVRLNCFGDKSYAAVIETEALDWRPNLNVPIAPWEVPSRLHQMVRRVLDYLKLEMGVIDMKLMSDGQPVWLEVNPQGQFLFLEGTTAMPLTRRFADFLLAGC